LGCQNERHIQDLQSLQSAINTLEKGLIDGTVDVESAQIEAEQLVVAYKELTKQEIVSSMQSFIFSLEEEKQKLQRL
jgi:phage tail tape-measure protein